ncbi:hypothetical protein LTR17_027076 [Elasticomyces elasticus]|nr:hypothetical protein LTR17_027076 [Elasticomyces elasticus]
MADRFGTAPGHRTPGLSRERKRASHTVFLALRLTLNLTNDSVKNCNVHARVEVVQYLLSTIETGFAALDASPPRTDVDADEVQQSALAYDLLVLATGYAINLFEHSSDARMHSLSSESTLIGLMATLASAQERIEAAESLSESSSNVAVGYLAVALTNLCQSEEIRVFIVSKLSLSVLMSAVSEFVEHHSMVDILEGEIYAVFTAEL